MASIKAKLAERLPELPSEVLAEILLQLAEKNTTLRRQLVALTSDNKELVQGIRRTITGWKTSQTYRTGAREKELRAKLTDIVTQIESVANTQPDLGWQLLCTLLTVEKNIRRNVDDGTGRVTEIFHKRIPAIAVTIITRCKNEADVMKWLNLAVEEDYFRSRWRLIDAIGGVLTEQNLQALFDTVHASVEATPRHKEYENRELAPLRKRILVALGDTTRFVEVCGYNGRIEGSDILTLVQMYIDHEDYVNAERWLTKLTTEGVSRGHGTYVGTYRDEARGLQLAIDVALGRADRVLEYWQELFFESPSEASFATLARYATTEQLASIREDLVELVINTTDPHFIAVQYLIETGSGREMEDVVQRYKPGIFVDYHTLPNVATAFEEAGFPLGASIVYRILMEDILNDARDSAYKHAVRYFQRIEALAPDITDWRGLAPHDTYRANIATRHALKYAFWLALQHTPKPLVKIAASGNRA